MRYRPEIDGLRAVAVLPVMFFHAGFTTFRGGFVGVDVFFVISGYLITTIVMGDLAEGRFSLAQFYARRARRILPALFVIVTACIPFAWLWMTPDQFEAFGESVIAVLLFVSNIHFWQESGYFAAAADLMPLLHTWSLAVEEQFYMIFPLLLIVAWRLGRTVIFGLFLLLATVSLVWAEMQWHFAPPASFFLSHTRAWELLIGSLCALVLFKRSLPANNWLAGLGLAMIVAAITKFAPWTEIPGIKGLVPVLGAALIILFGSPGTQVARLLSMRGFVGIGLISYSTYLWHQPLFAFARLRSAEGPSPVVLLALCAASLFLGWITWWLVEIPWRRRGNVSLRSQKVSSAAAAALAVALFGFGVSAAVTNGLPQRFPDGPRQQFTEGRWSRNCLFQARGGRVDFPTEECIFGEGSFKIAILGDSIAASLAPAVIDRFRDMDVEIHQLTHGMCMPAVRTIATTPLAVACADYTERAVQYLEEMGVDLVVTAASWPDFGQSTLYDGQSISDMTNAQRDLVADDIESTLKRLDAPVLMIMPYPHADFWILDTAARHYLSDGELIKELAVPLEQFMAENAVALDVLSRVEDVNIAKVFAHEAMCDSEQCYFLQDQKLILSDNQHLTRYGAEKILALPSFNHAVTNIFHDAGRIPASRENWASD
ncbi:acyltransferase family protein [Paracoccus rhizosphaerae]|uniref:Acyltransferase family protein n=1 Tax=Paracoccus rhizosphaerae TaxID=1133347 RepID=A0ABV6CMU7_9RHOB|nr:acyltransferase family protein [Paracoccus rhizosphaerae]